MTIKLIITQLKYYDMLNVWFFFNKIIFFKGVLNLLVFTVICLKK